MIIRTLVDTSVWIDHFNKPNERLRVLVDNRFALSHPLIIGELACGRIPDRAGVLQFISALRQTTIPSPFEVLDMIESLELYGRGLGWIDVNLIASALLSRAYLYSHDKKLIAVSSELDLLGPT